MYRIFEIFILCIWTVIGLLTLGFSNSFAMDKEELSSSFKSEMFSQEELRILQAGLALNGNYFGLIDGAWGKGSSDAFNQFAISEGNPPMNFHAAYLAILYLASVEEYGWQMYYIKPIGLSILLPFAKITDSEESDFFVTYGVENSTLGISFNLDNGQNMSAFHQLAESHNRIGEPYVVRKDSAWITKYTDSEGTSGYVRSNPFSGLWGTIILTAGATEANLLALMSSSITRDGARDIKLPEDGYLSELVAYLMDELGTSTKGSVAEPSLPEPTINNDSSKVNSETISTGSGFYVTPSGFVLTNAHVVENCDQISSGAETYSLVDISNKYDLAILRLDDQQAEVPYAEFAEGPARLNSDITVVGYPLTGILGGLNVTRGSISSVSGLGGNEDEYQVSAPVQAGNSGGPVLDQDGRVVAVVVAKIREDVIADETGDIPQNINFAIKGEIAKNYLFTNGVKYKTSADDIEIDASDLAENAEKFTVLLECH